MSRQTLWCEMTRRERRAFKRKRRPLTQDQKCGRGDHLWRPWYWSGLWSNRECANCGERVWGISKSPEYLNRVQPPSTPPEGP